MPDHFREPARTMGPRSPGSDHSQSVSLVLKKVDESNSLVHKKKVVESKLVLARSPQRPSKSFSGGSDTTSGFSSDASGENRISPVSISVSTNLQNSNNERGLLQDFSVERFIEDSTSDTKKGREAYEGISYGTAPFVDDSQPIALVVDSKISTEDDFNNQSVTGSSKNTSGYTSPADDSGHDGEVEDNLDTSGSSSPATYSERHLKDDHSVKTEETVKSCPNRFRERKEMVIPQVILERKINYSISDQRKSTSQEEYTNERNKILPNVTIQKVVSKEIDIHNEESSKEQNCEPENLIIQEDNKRQRKAAGIKIKEFARFDTDVVDAAEMERQLIGSNARYEHTLAALTGASKKHIPPSERISRCESLLKGDISVSEDVFRDNWKKSIILNTSKTSEEGYKPVDYDVDIRSERSSVDTWISSASYHTSVKIGESIAGSIEHHTDQGTSEHACTYCDKIFYNSYHLASHLVTHTGEKSFACPKCGKSFGRRSTLRAHMTTHSKTSNFMCPVCEKACNDNNSLEEHIRMHTGEKPFICTVCNKAYARKSHLSVHYRVHTGERPFVCVDCGKDFTEKRFLNDHMQTSHSGVAGGNDSGPLKCPNCYREFAYKTSLKQHLKKQMCVRNLTRVGGNVSFQGAHAKQFSCPFCDKSYSWKQTLKQHVSMYHRNKVHTDEFWKYEMAKQRRTVVDDKDRNDDMWQQQLGRHGQDDYGKSSTKEHSYGLEHAHLNNADPSHAEKWLQQIQRSTVLDSQKKSHLPAEMKMIALQSLQSSLKCGYKNKSCASEEDQHLGEQTSFALEHISRKDIKKECDNQQLSWHHPSVSDHPSYYDHKQNRLQHPSNKHPQDDNYLSLLAHISAERKASEEEKQEVEERDRRNQQYQKDGRRQVEKNGSSHGKDNLDNELHRSQCSMSQSSQQQQLQNNWSVSPPKELAQVQRSLSRSPPVLALPDIKEESSVTRTQMWLAQLGQYRQNAVQEEMEKNHDELWEEQISRVRLNPVKSPIEHMEITIDDESNKTKHEQTAKEAIYLSKGYDVSKIGTDESSMSTENSSSVSTISKEVNNYNLCKRGIMTPLISALQVQQNPNPAFEMISEYNKTYTNNGAAEQPHKLASTLSSTPPSMIATEYMPCNKPQSSSPALSVIKNVPPPPPVSPISSDPLNPQSKQQVSFNSLLSIRPSTIVNVNGQNIKMVNSENLRMSTEEDRRNRLSTSPKHYNERIYLSTPMESNNNDPQHPPTLEVQAVQEDSLPPPRHIPLAVPPLKPNSHLALMTKRKQQKSTDIHGSSKDTSTEINIPTIKQTQGQKPKYQPPDPSTFGTSSVLKMLLLDPTKRKRPSTTPPPPSSPLLNKKMAISPTNNFNLQKSLHEIKTPAGNPNVFNNFSGAPSASEETDILRRRLLGIKDSPKAAPAGPKPTSVLLPKPKYSPPSATITSADIAETESVPQKKSPIAVEEFTKVAAAAATLASFNLPRDPDGLRNKECASRWKMTKKVAFPLNINDERYQEDVSKSVQRPHKQQLLSTEEHLVPLSFEEDIGTSERDKSITDFSRYVANNDQEYCTQELVKERYISDKNPLKTKRDILNNNQETTVTKHTTSPAASSTPSYAKTSVLKHLLYRYTTYSANNNNNPLIRDEGEIFSPHNNNNNNN